MKKILFTPLLLALSWVVVCAQPVQVVGRGPNHRAWSGENTSYIELCSGVCRWDEIQKQWVESSTEIELFADAAVARRGQSKAIFAANANAVGGMLDILSPGNQRLVVTPIGLAYYSRSGRSVMIAGLRDCEGFVQGNSVYYVGAFDGGFLVTVQIVYNLGSIEQFVIIQESPPPPSDFAGFENEPLGDVFLEVWNEFQSPQPSIRETVIKREANENLRKVLAEPDVVDKRLDFNGDVVIAGGRAFDLGSHDPFGPESAVTVKDWINVGGRTFLVEKIPYLLAQPHLRVLPAPGAKAQRPVPAEPMMARAFPPPPRGERGSWRASQQAALNPLDKGYAVDWQMLTSLVTNQFFGPTNTIYVSGECNLYGTSVLSSAVIKFSPTNSASLHFLGPAIFDTGPGRPLICTARDDATVGNAVGSSQLSLISYYGARALQFDDFYPYAIEHVRLSHLDTAITFQYDTGHSQSLTHVQIDRCGIGLCEFNTTVRLRNVLMHNLGTNFYSHTYLSTNHCEHLTVSQAGRLNVTTSTNRLYMTNCLLVEVNAMDKGYETNQSSCVEVAANAASVFQSVGGSAYLIQGSPYRDAGTTNIDASLAADLKTLTTYPPILLEGRITLDTVLGATAPRDQDIPDLGYHFEPLDWLLAAVEVTNATVSVEPGTALGAFGAIAFWLNDYSTLLCQGTPTRPVTLVRYYAVQEGTTNRGTVLDTMISGYNQSNSPPVVRWRFTESFVAPGGGYHFYANNAQGWRFNNVEIRDSSLYGGGLNLIDRAGATYGLTNNLMRRVSLQSTLGAQNLYLCNNLWKDDFGTTLLANTSAFKFYDNFLDSGALKNQNASLVHQCNAYYNASTFYSLYTTNATEQVLGSRSYESWGPWDYYLPSGSSLIDGKR